MHRRWMWTAVDGLPLCFIAEKGRVRSPSAGAFRQNKSKVYQQTPIPILGLTFGGALGCYIYTEKEDNYG